MKAHHTKDKGDIGVFKAQADLAEKGWLILKPQTEHAPFDLVIYKDQTFKKVQVKYRTINKIGQLTVSLKSVWSDKNGIHTSPIDRTEVDIVCIYCPELDQCLYVDIADFSNSQAVILRVEEPKNNQKKKIKLSKDYLEI
jgi:hypothetical protein